MKKMTKCLINNKYPDPIQLKKLEQRTFIYLKSSKAVISKFLDLSSKSGIQADMLSSSKKLEKTDIDFESFFDIDMRKIKYRISLGSKIMHDYSQVTYYLVVGEFKSKKALKPCLRRKYHFDYDMERNIKNHPVFHLQYGGTMSPGLNEYSDSYNSVLYPALSEPRLLYTPMTLSILLNQVFGEFQCEDTRKIYEHDIWKDIVKTNEETVLKPYFAQCTEFFNNHHASARLFTREFCFGH